jgi:anti-sigma-K factor RskA
MESHDTMLDDVAAYALGVLPASEAAAVRAHMETCAECRTEYDALAPAVTAIAYSAEATAAQLPGPELKARIMRAVRPPVLARRSISAWPGWLAAAACVAIAVGFGTQNQRLQHDLVAERATTASQQAALSAANASAEREHRMIADLAASDARRYPFVHGVFVTRGSHLYVAIRAPQSLPKGRVYQAWTVAKGSKVVRPSITFSAPGSSVTMVEIPASAQSLAAVALSVEPEGGSLKPTTKPIALVKLSS